MAYLDDPDVRGPHPDGSYTVVGGAGDWTLLDTGAGWEASHPHAEFCLGIRWASAEDAACAVLADPGLARKWGES